MNDSRESAPSWHWKSDRATLSIDELAAVTGLGRTTIYERVLVPGGTLPKLKIGTRTLVRCQDLITWLEEQARQGGEEDK